MVDKICRAVYPYQGNNADELVLEENEEITIISAVDADWVSAQNAKGEVGFVPAAYLEVIADAPPRKESLSESNDTANSGEPEWENEATGVSNLHSETQVVSTFEGRQIGCVTHH